jgi:hypothetical protein
MDLFAPECTVPMDYWSKYYAKMFLLPVLFCVMGLLFFLRNMYSRRLPQEARPASSSMDLFTKLRWRMHNKRIPIATRIRAGFKLLVPMMTTASITLYTYLVSNSLSPFNCLASRSSSGEVIYFMVGNPTARCYDSEWNSHLLSVVFFSFVYGVVFPVAILIEFFKHRNGIDEPDFGFRYGSLIFLYKRVYFFWELVSMLKRASFVVATQFLSSQANLYAVKFASTIGTMGLFTALELYYQPYSMEMTNLGSST